MHLKKTFSFSFILACLLLFAIGFILKRYYYNTETIHPEFKKTEIVLTFLGCSNCPAANNKLIPTTLKKITHKLHQEATSKGYSYAYIGISNESNIKQGLEYLTNIAPFHEISLGKSMQNTAIQKYVWNAFDSPLSASIPQIIISERTYDVKVAAGDTIVQASINAEKILARKIGMGEIIQLSDQHSILKD